MSFEPWDDVNASVTPNSDLKYCSGCDTSKPRSAFPIETRWSPTGKMKLKTRSQCRNCLNAKRQARDKRDRGNPENRSVKQTGPKFCNGCGQMKPRDAFPVETRWNLNGTMKLHTRSQCRNCLNAKRRARDRRNYRPANRADEYGFKTCEECHRTKGLSAFRGPRGRICITCQADRARARKREYARSRPGYKGAGFVGNPTAPGQKFAPSEHPNKYHNLLRKLRHAKRRGDDARTAHYERRLHDEFGWRPR